MASAAEREVPTWPMQLRGTDMAHAAARRTVMLCSCEGGDAACVAVMGAAV
jgi:hypothetical protein